MAEEVNTGGLHTFRYSGKKMTDEEEQAFKDKLREEREYRKLHGNRYRKKYLDQMKAMGHDPDGKHVLYDYVQDYQNKNPVDDLSWWWVVVIGICVGAIILFLRHVLH